MTDSQLRANQQNAQHSTGPRTEEGKARARFNARRHGLTGQFYVMDEYDRQAYQTFESGIMSDLSPEGPYERQLAISIAQDHWRMNRAKGIEFNTMGVRQNQHDIDADSPEAETAVSNAQTWNSDNKAFANMALYETRLNRIIANNRKELNQLQTIRKAVEVQAMEEAELFLAHQLAQNIPENHETIKVNGFVFSIGWLYEKMQHKQVIAEARWYKSQGWNYTKRPPFALLNFPKAA